MERVKVDRYSLLLEPDFENSTFAGTASLECSFSGSDGAAGDAEETVVALHSLDLDIKSVETSGGCGVASYEADPGRQLLEIRFDGNPRLRETITIVFSGRLNDGMVGFYRSRLGADWCAVTQFEERDARRAFPCIDHPGRKSVFDIALVAPPGATAVSNTVVLDIVDLPDGRRRYLFAPTPPMSTYLLFFGVGPFDAIEETGGRIPIRVLGAPGRVESGSVSIPFARDALEYFESYTGVEYPLGKLDLIGVPDFAYGAMENFGAITYRENYLYLDPTASSQQDIQRMATITAHEVAHMWFGDLVSPADWSYVWLNEAFATYFGNLVTESTHPEWEVLKQFVSGTRASAMERDGLPGTIPIEVEKGTFTEIDPSTAPIIYSKAGAVLHMMREYLGEERFRSGVHAYLSAHRFAATDTEGFLSSFAEGAGPESRAIIEHWVRRPGYPLIRSRRVGDRVELTQERFVYGGSSAGVWPTPITVLVVDEAGAVTSVRLLLDHESGAFDLPGRAKAYKINAEQAGYYRVRYAPDDLLALSECYASFGELDRAGLLDDLYALFLAGELGFGEILDFVDRAFDEESAELPTAALGRILTICVDLLPSLREKAVEALLRSSKRAFDRVGTEPRPVDTPADVRIRSRLLWSFYRAGEEAAATALRCGFERIERGGEVSPDLLPIVYRYAAAARAVEFEWFTRQIEDESASEARRRHLLAGMVWYPDANELRRVLDYIMQSVPQRNRHFAVDGAVANPSTHPLLLPWLTRSVGELRKTHGYAFASIVASTLPVAGIGRTEATREFADTELRPIGAAGPIDMALERMEVFDRFVDRIEGWRAGDDRVERRPGT